MGRWKPPLHHALQHHTLLVIVAQQAGQVGGVLLRSRLYLRLAFHESWRRQQHWGSLLLGRPRRGQQLSSLALEGGGLFCQEPAAQSWSLLLLRAPRLRLLPRGLRPQSQQRQRLLQPALPRHYCRRHAAAVCIAAPGWLVRRRLACCRRSSRSLLVRPPAASRHAPVGAARRSGARLKRDAEKPRSINFTYAPCPVAARGRAP